jgi:hypothetical protein
MSALEPFVGNGYTSYLKPWSPVSGVRRIVKDNIMHNKKLNPILVFLH